MAAFREEFAKSKHLVVLTGAGVSAESGVPTFRGAGGFWRKWQAQVVLQGSHASGKVLDIFLEYSKTWKVLENHFGSRN